MRKRIFCLPFALMAVVCTLNIIPQTLHAQTVYKQEKGLFTGLPSFSAQGNGGNGELLLGPWMGYRFNEKTDLALHTEYFSDERFDFSLINIGLKAGYTFHTSSIIWRNELSIYRLFNLSKPGGTLPAPKAFTVGGFTTGYYPVPVSKKADLLPYIGLFGFLGTREMPPTKTNYLSGHEDGFVSGIRLGTEVNMAFSSSFTWTLGAGYAFAFTNRPAQTYDGFILNLQFNF